MSTLVGCLVVSPTNLEANDITIVGNPPQIPQLDQPGMT